MSFKEMDPEIVLKLLEGHQDVLGPMVKKEEALYNTSCPNCRAFENESIINIRRPFTPGHPLPNKILRCLHCGTEFDPYTKLAIKVPTSGLG